MKNIENMKALSDMAMEAVAGGDDDYTVVDAFVDWLLGPIEDALNNIVVSDDRPLPFSQDRPVFAVEALVFAGVEGFADLRGEFVVKPEVVQDREAHPEHFLRLDGRVLLDYRRARVEEVGVLLQGGRNERHHNLPASVGVELLRP